MLKTIEAQVNEDTVPPAVLKEFWQYEFERLRTFTMLVYCASAGIWTLFDLIVSFQGGQGFTYKSVIVISAMVLCIIGVKVIGKAHHFHLLNVAFVGLMSLSISLIVDGVDEALRPTWLTLAASTILYSASVLPLRRWSFFTALVVTWAILNPFYTADIDMWEFGGTMAISYITFLTGLIIYSYLTMRQAKLHNFCMARLLLDQAYLDALTEIPNRRSFMTTAGTQIKKAAEAHDHYLAMIDIDNFKKVNDTFGHDVGDIVLKRVAGNIKAAMPEFEFARLGGEEFAIYLWGLPQQEAECRIAALCLRVRTDPAQYPVTVSIGLTHIETDDTLTSALIKADAALYTSKHSGKNKYTLHRTSVVVHNGYGGGGTGTQA